jgi:hypothetical protein
VRRIYHTDFPWAERKEIPRVQKGPDVVRLVLHHKTWTHFSVLVDVVTVNPTWQKIPGSALWGLRRRWDASAGKAVYSQVFPDALGNIDEAKLVQELAKFCSDTAVCYDTLAHPSYLFMCDIDNVHEDTCEELHRKIDYFSWEDAVVMANSKMLHKLVEKKAASNGTYKLIRPNVFKVKMKTNKVQ